VSAGGRGSGAELLRGVPIWSGGPEGAWVDALLIREGRVVAVGSEAEVEAAAPRGTRRVRVQGGCLLPGFVDAHTHFLEGGYHLGRVDLRVCATRDDFSAIVAARVGDAPEGRGWILGGNWEEQRWGGGLPSRGWLDPVTGDRPAFLTRSDLHMGVANTEALRRAGIDADTPDPPGGRIDRDPATGAPTGLLRDRAMTLVRRAIPVPGPAELDAALAAACRHALSLGITQVHDLGTWTLGSLDHLETARRARAAGDLPVRLVCAVPLGWRRELAALVEAEGRGDDRLRWGAVKGFVDGSVGSSTAWFHEPYADQPDNRGIVLTPLDELASELREAYALGLQLFVHAIGDAAVAWIVERYRDFLGAGGGDRRLRVEHVQHLTPGVAERMAAAGIVAGVQPAHLVDDGSWLHTRIGEERIAGSYAFGTLARAGVRLALGTDWTVVPLDPMPGIRAALTRRDRAGGRLNPAEALPLDRVLEAATWTAAWSGFNEATTGALQPGYHADFVVLDADVRHHEWEGGVLPRVVQTRVGGEVVHAS
jgi:hypothetical protein